MGFYVDREMPVNCDDCVFSREYGDGSYICGEEGEKIDTEYLTEEQRPEWCPLIEVFTARELWG